MSGMIKMLIDKPWLAIPELIGLLIMIVFSGMLYKKGRSAIS